MMQFQNIIFRLCKDESKPKYKTNSPEQKQSINLKRAQEMIEKNKLKREMIANIQTSQPSKDDMYH